jgi:hypothetical protein
LHKFFERLALRHIFHQGSVVDEIFQIQLLGIIFLRQMLGQFTVIDVFALVLQHGLNCVSGLFWGEIGQS